MAVNRSCQEKHGPGLRTRVVLLAILAVVLEGCGSLTTQSTVHTVRGETITVDNTQELWFKVQGVPDLTSLYHDVSDENIRVLEEGAVCRSNGNVTIESSLVRITHAAVSGGMNGDTEYIVPDKGGLKLAFTCVIEVPVAAETRQEGIWVLVPNLFQVTRSLGSAAMQRDFERTDNGFSVATVVVHASPAGRMFSRFGWVLFIVLVVGYLAFKAHLRRRRFREIWEKTRAAKL